MKTLRTIATLIIAAFLVLGPTVAFAAISVTPNATSYSGQQVVQISGTVSPAPVSPSSSVVVTTKGPMGVVDIGVAPVATGTGAYTYTYVSGGSVGWVSGTYTVNATWGLGGTVSSSTATYQYTATQGGGGGGGSTAINVQVTASTPAVAGQQEYIGILTSFAGNGSLAAATFQTVHFHTPQGTLVTLCSSTPPVSGCTGTFATIHKGFYQINFTAPATAGGYFIHAWTNGPVVSGVSSGQGQGLGQFTIETAATGGGGSNGPQLTAIQTTLATMTTTLNGIQSSIQVLTAGFGTINTGIQSLTTSVNGLSGLTASVNTVSSGVTNIQSTLTNLSTNLTAVNGIGAQLTSLNNAINNNQTYVLVVAALAAITLVLELAILVRKLS